MFAKEKDCFSASVLIALIGGLLSGYFFLHYFGEDFNQLKTNPVEYWCFFHFPF